MSDIKITPTLAKAIASEIARKVREERSKINENNKQIILASKEFKKLKDLHEKILKLNKEKQDIIDYFKSKYNMYVSSFHVKPEEWNIQASTKYLSEESIKHRVLVESSFSKEEFNTIVNNLVKEFI